MAWLRTWVLMGAVLEMACPSWSADPFQTGDFRWTVTRPFLSVNAQRLPPSEDHPWLAIKDPSIVRHDGRWHLFCTLRKQIEGDGRIRIGYLSFEDWDDAVDADWSVLNLTMGYHGAPQIFFFEPHQTWYLVYQAEDATRELKYGPCYSTNPDITNPAGWTLPEPLYVVKEGARAGLDYWVICDDANAYLFFTTLDGHMWRSRTAIDRFPSGPWTDPTVALKADLFEASHTYSLHGRNQFLTVVEAQGDQRRYFKGFLADSLDGPWKPLAATPKHPLVSPKNVVNQSDSWSTSYSHGEFIRMGINEHLEVDPKGLELLFQGANDQEYRQPNYGQIRWRLGRLMLQGS
ncbi:non-reducing end alpha-L-arabinofuranosidase family hydrolase [Rubripirellula amarantea]|nr:non-reducing end alpha-L-arabinofuranosidase family hydrolase [Rubripirellula amarantea]